MICALKEGLAVQFEPKFLSSLPIALYHCSFQMLQVGHIFFELRLLFSQRKPRRFIYIYIYIYDSVSQNLIHGDTRPPNKTFLFRMYFWERLLDWTPICLTCYWGHDCQRDCQVDSKRDVVLVKLIQIYSSYNIFELIMTCVDLSE